MIHRLNTYRYHDVDDDLVNAVADEVERRILDRFYHVPTWVDHHAHGVSSRGEDLSRMDSRSLLELRWRVLFRHRLDPDAGIGYRLEWIDRWIQDALRDEATNDAAAASGIRWGVDEPNHDPELDRPVMSKRNGSFEYRRRTGAA